jgi:hypothetical protein
MDQGEGNAVLITSIVVTLRIQRAGRLSPGTTMR